MGQPEWTAWGGHPTPSDRIQDQSYGATGVDGMGYPIKLQEVIEQDDELEGIDNKDGSSLSLSLQRLKRLSLQFLRQLSSICSKCLLYCPACVHNRMPCPQLNREPPGVCNSRGLVVEGDNVIEDLPID